MADHVFRKMQPVGPYLEGQPGVAGNQDAQSAAAGFLDQTGGQVGAGRVAVMAHDNGAAGGQGAERGKRVRQARLVRH